MDYQTESGSSSSRVQEIKHRWHFSSPDKLYDQCVKLLVRNIDLVLVVNKKRSGWSEDEDEEEERKIQIQDNDYVTSKLDMGSASKQRGRFQRGHSVVSRKHMLKYKIVDKVGPLPNFICTSLLRAYQLYYNDQLGRFERDQYFKLNRTFATSSKDLIHQTTSNKKDLLDQAISGSLVNTNPKNNSSIQKEAEHLVTYYDLLMAIVAHKNKTSLDSVEYRSCIWEHSTLETRLETIANNNSDKKANQTTALRSKQPVHLSDSDLKLIIKRKRTLEYLDICPCNLTNRSVVLMNKYLNKNLKYLRFQNCCNWLPNEPRGAEDSDHELAIGNQNIELPNLFADNIRFRYVNEGSDSEVEDTQMGFVDGQDIVMGNQRQQEEQSNESDHNDYFLNGNGVLQRARHSQDRMFENMAETSDSSNREEIISQLASFENNAHSDNEDDEEEEEFDAYLQEYIDMYTNVPLTNSEPNYETRLEEIIASETQNAVEDQEDIMLLSRVDSSFKRKHQNHNNQPTETSSSSDSSSVPICSTKCQRSNSRKRDVAEKENLLEFYENQLRLIRNYSQVSSNRCKLFSLSDEARLKQERKIRKIQRAIKLLRRINLQNHVGENMWENNADNVSRVSHKKTSIKRDNDTKSLLKLLFLNPEISAPQTAPTSTNSSVKEDTTETGTGAPDVVVMETDESISLIEQIRLKAQYLRETKLIDKVSLASSNFDEYNAHDFITTEADKQDDMEQSTYTAERRKRDSFKKSFLLSSSISGTPSSMGSSSSLLSIGQNGNIKQMAGAGKSTSSSIYFDQEDNNGEESGHESVSCVEPLSVATTITGETTALAATTAAGRNENDMFETLSSSSTSSMSSSSFSSLIVPLSSLNTTTTSASSTSTFFSSNSTSPYTATDQNSHQFINPKAKHHLLKQQRLLEKATNLSSSPINLLQSIAAKALNFKLKNSSSGHKSRHPKRDVKSETEMHGKTSASTSKSQDTKTAANYNRLLRQYRFFKSTNISADGTAGNRLAKSKSPCRSRSRKIFKRTKCMGGDDTASVATTAHKENDMLAKESSAAACVDSEPAQQRIPAHLFSSFKYWMSKRMDLLNNSQPNSEDSSTKPNTSKSSVNPEQNLNFAKNKPLLCSSSSDSFNSSLSIPTEHLEAKRRTIQKRHKQRTMCHDTRLIKSLGIECLNLSHLLHLSFRNLGPNVIDVRVLNAMLVNLKLLQFLDISNCCTGKLFDAPVKLELFNSKAAANSDIRVARNCLARKFLIRHVTKTESVGSLYGLLHVASTLTHLVMADLSVNDVQLNLPYVLCLSQLKHLDVSHCKEVSSLNRYTNPSLHLAKLAHHLTQLTSLDISATNLSGPSLFNEAEEISYMSEKLYEDFEAHVEMKPVKTIKSSIPGLMFLNCEKLSFLGCFCCDHSVTSRRTQLPAVRIASEESEQHLYTALETYSERPLFLLDVLNHLFELYRDEAIEDKLLGGFLIMNTMDKYLDHSRIQISGCASLFYVLKYWKEENGNVQQLPYFYLRRLINTVINGMEEHIDDSAMRRNCVLIMCRLNLPDDVLFVSDRLIKILLKIFDEFVKSETKHPNNEGPEHFVLRTSMHLLNILACSVHGSNKSRVGQLAIPIAMDLIQSKIRFEEADDVLEVTWSFLWNITDETPENCEIFLDQCDGMEAFMDCIKFKKSEIIRNMMGLLGNVAEVPDLRNRLCKSNYIDTFRQLLFHKNDGIEIPYNSAGVLVHIMSDGEQAWVTSGCQLDLRFLVINDIERAVDGWDIKSERNINYRSFEPIFRLIDQCENPICQRWSCWALANLTTVYPDIYCPLFVKENGNSVLSRVMTTPNVNEAVKQYTQIVLDNITSHTQSLAILNI